tara:strand:- start:591 stop:1037 length:447 start_codon:yes stop_codon:yes gene_type:complete
MTEISPHSGFIKDAIHHFPLRVYYEDTDVGGVVYYANYLKFMERARSEMLRVLGIDQKEMLDYNKPEDVSFVVRRAELDFNQSAEFDDHLMVTSEIIKLGGASLVIKQDIMRNDETLVSGNIKIAAIGRDGNPKRLPVGLRKKLELKD